MTYIGRSPPGHTPVTVKQRNTDTKNDLDLDSGRTQMPGLRLWGHRIILSGGKGIRCEECEMEEEVPEILTMSSGFREVVYKLYLLGKFKNTRCEPEFETDNSVMFSDNSTLKVDVGDGDVLTDGTTIFKSTSDQYHAGDLLTEKEFMKLSDKTK